MTASLAETIAPVAPLERSGREGDRGRVLVVAIQPFFSDRGTPIAVRYLLQALSELGHEVDLLTVPLGTDVSIPNVRILRVANPFGFDRMPVGLSLAKIVFDLLVMLRLRKLLRDGNYQRLHAVEETAYIAMLSGQHRRLPLIYDMASSLPEQLASGEPIRSRLMRVVLEPIERALLARASTIICSAGLGAGVRAMVPEKPVHEWVFPAERPVADAAGVAALRRELGIPEGARVALYGGTFARYQGVDLLLSALPALAKGAPEAVLVCVGASDEVEIQAAEAAVPAELRHHIRLRKRVSKAEMPCYFAMADVLLSPRTYGGNIPLKIFDYLATGVPIVATDLPTHRSVLTEELAVLVEPTPSAFADGIARVLEDEALAGRLSANALAYAGTHLSWPGFVALVERIYASAGRGFAARASREVA